MNLSVIGTGHVGLVVGLCLAEIGHDVVCVDNDAHKVKTLKKGRTPFYEPYLGELLGRNAAAGRVRFTESLEEAVRHSNVIFLCLGTPPLPGGEADLSMVERVTREIATLSDCYKLIIEKSTVPVLTGERIQTTLEIYARRQRDFDFDVASNPEFLAEGTAVLDFLYPDRIVIGVESEQAARLLREVYEPIIRQSFDWRLSRPCPRDGREIPMLVTNPFLAMKISYINAVANLCDQVGADILQVAEGMGYDHRIGPHFLRAGIGFGGFCFPKDLQAFIRIAEKSGCDFELLRQVEAVNQAQVDLFLRKVKNELWVLKNKTLAVWGLAFKPHTDDLRFSPALAVVDRLIEEEAAVRAHDPQAMEEACRAYPQLTYCSSALEAAQGADAVLLLTDWPEYRGVGLEQLRKAMVRPLILDGRNHLDAEAVRAAGFEYVGMGRP